MSDIITLTLGVTLDDVLDVGGLTPDRLSELSESEIANCPAWLGRQSVKVGDVFDVRGGHSAHVRVEGALTRVEGLAAGMSGGEMVIEGDAGRRVAEGMLAGSVEVRGSVGDDAGVAMAGGMLRVQGSAGDRLGAALPGAAKGMTGGEIVVLGSAGTEVAARCRRGLVVVAGNVGDHAARAMIAGTLIVFGRTGAAPARGNKRGSLVGIGPIEPPATYRYACTYRPPHVRLTMTYLHRRHRLAIDTRMLDGRYRRYCGDEGVPGKGEILELVND